MVGAVADLAKKTVSYFYDEDIGDHNLGAANPMRPHRVRLTTKLLEGYELTRRMKVHRPRHLSYEELNMFHCDEYLGFLKSVTPDNQQEYMSQLKRFNLGIAGEADCPVFDDMYNYCQIYSGGSRDGALNLIEGQAEIAFNWAGGMHHAKRAEASGFCYVNDIVLAILELLKCYQRVLYVDIDIHHGDGVEEAFYLTDRVMTVSFHKYGDFFPGTGALDDTGFERGHRYSVNVPLREGMDDASYESVFQPVMQKVLEKYRPEAIVVCAGADSLSGDRLGCFNLSLEGHSACLEFLAHANVPLLILGGGGYTMRNVSRCWTFETARLQGIELPDQLPNATLSRFHYFYDTQRLRIDVSNMMNLNSQADLDRIREQILKNLATLPPPSGIAIGEAPGVGKLPDAPEGDPDVRGGGAELDEARAVKHGYDSDEEGPNGRAVGDGSVGSGHYAVKDEPMKEGEEEFGEEQLSTDEAGGAEEAEVKEEASVAGAAPHDAGSHRGSAGASRAGSGSGSGGPAHVVVEPVARLGAAGDGDGGQESAAQQEGFGDRAAGLDAATFPTAGSGVPGGDVSFQVRQALGFLGGNAIEGGGGAVDSSRPAGDGTQ